MEEKFDFENLEVWQRSVDFAELVLSVLDNLSTTEKHYRMMEQMEAACTSIAMNIAEGKGRHHDKEYLKFLYYARGSLYETITLLLIFQKRNWIDQDSYQTIRQEAVQIAKMLNGLIRAIRRRL